VGELKRDEGEKERKEILSDCAIDILKEEILHKFIILMDEHLNI
jgi:hypothetical protein